MKPITVRITIAGQSGTGKTTLAFFLAGLFYTRKWPVTIHEVSDRTKFIIGGNSIKNIKLDRVRRAIPGDVEIVIQTTRKGAA